MELKTAERSGSRQRFWGNQHADHPTTVYRLVSCHLAGRERRRRAAQTVAIDTDDIGGTVNGPAGPEAGVWVIAETDDFDTRYAKIVVTDDQGRYVVPDLAAGELSGLGARLRPRRLGEGRWPPRANVESRRERGAVAGRGAVVYPAAYWYSMMKVPQPQRGRARCRAASTNTSRRSRTCRASAAIRSASSRRARCRRSSASYRAITTRGCGAFSRAKRASRCSRPR